MLASWQSSDRLKSEPVSVSRAKFCIKVCEKALCFDDDMINASYKNIRMIVLWSLSNYEVLYKAYKSKTVREQFQAQPYIRG